MNKTIRKSSINGTLAAPGSKSAMQRILVAAMLAEGESLVHYKTLNADSEAILEAIQKIGALVTYRDSEIIKIKGGSINSNISVNIGESGLGLRMLSPIVASFPYISDIQGYGTILKRPIDFVIETLRSTGVRVKSTHNSLPIQIQGPITTNMIMIDGSVGSQLLTGYLMAAPLLNKDIEIMVDNLKSKSYIDLTIRILEEFGIKVENQAYQKFLIKKGQNYHPHESFVEGDWSGSAFPLVAGAISGNVIVNDLNINSTQGDKAIIEVIKSCGANVTADSNSFRVKKAKLKAFNFDATDTPDLFPPLVALAVNCEGISIIKGVSRLKHKESDRGLSLQAEFRKLGANILIDRDLMIIEGTKLKGKIVNSHQDHRIAMALATAAINAENEVVIENAEAVGKSWPEFFSKMSELGAIIE